MTTIPVANIPGATTPVATAPEGTATGAKLRSVAAALERLTTTLARRPASGVHDDVAAEARLDGATRTVVRHPDGTCLATDMPAAFGGGGADVSPGWLFRAGLASCAATSIALVAARRGIVLSALSVRAASRSDTRGLLAIADAHGHPVPAGPLDVELRVSIDADDVPDAVLRALVDDALAASPVPSMVRTATPLDVRVEVAGSR